MSNTVQRHGRWASDSNNVSDDDSYPSLQQRLRTIADQVTSTIFLPVRIATSKVAIQTYITSILLFTTSLFLFGLAVAAYITFYWSYVPRVGFTRQVHLQFDHAASVAPVTPINAFMATPSLATPGNSPTAMASKEVAPSYPWGTVDLASEIVSQQLYDITVHLTLPRTPENMAQGNFMLDASLLAASSSGIASVVGAQPSMLAHSRRAAILTYYSREIDIARKLLHLPGYLAGLYFETENIKVQLFEGIEFPRGWRNVPSSLKLEIQSRERTMQVYSCNVSFHARFRGLRWIMYNYRIASAVFFISAFWVTEMVAMSAAWLMLSLFVFPGTDKTTVKSEKGNDKVIKQEEDEEETPEGDGENLSDTERTYPSYGGAPMLRYQSPGIKREEQSEEPFPPLVAPEAADDEDEEDDFVLDSGLGTSMESSAGSRRDSQVRRRKSGKLRTGS